MPEQQLPREEEVNVLLNKYKKRLSKELKINPEILGQATFSREYKQFKKEYIPKRLTLYEKACKISEKILRLKPDKKKAPLIQESIDISHLDVTPSGVISFSILGPIILVLVGALLSFALFNSMFFVFFFLIHIHLLRDLLYHGNHLTSFVF